MSRTCHYIVVPRAKNRHGGSNTEGLENETCDNLQGKFGGVIRAYVDKLGGAKDVLAKY